jgi:hypothetical protein
LSFGNLTPIAGCIAAVVLTGCAAYSGAGFLTGVTTADEVRAAMGAPRNVYPDAEGGETWEYPRGPLGYHTFMVRLDGSRHLHDIEQVLDEEHFARIEVGKTTQKQVQRLIGTPARSTFFERRRETVWDYRFRDAWGYSSQFHVGFDERGIVRHKIAVREYDRELAAP